MKKCSLALLPLLFVTGCAVGNKKDPGIQTAPYYEKDSSPTLEGVKIPVMQSFEFDKKWGKPKIVVLGNGGYLLRYSQPGSSFETLQIFGAPGRIESDAPTPPPYTDIDAPDAETGYARTKKYAQRWSTVTLLGRPVHYYLRQPGSGADAPQWSTVSFCLETPDAPVASYRILASSNQQDGTKIMEGYMKTVGF